jgi:hypothetical protein
MDSLIDIDEPVIKDKIIKTLHYYLNNDINGNCINSFIEFYSNLNINRDKLKNCIYNYISEIYFQELIRKCHNTTIDIKDIQGSLSNCDTYYYHGYGTFNIHYVYHRFLFNELNDSINNNYESLNDSINNNYDTIKNNFDILNGKLIDTNHIIKNNYDILNEKISDTNMNIDNKTKILIDNYHILDKSIMNMNSIMNANTNVKLKKLDDNYRLLIKINLILFITVIYNLLFK